MAARMIELLDRYGDREFGEEWWPQDARAWLDADKARELALTVRDPGTASAEAGAIMAEYGETKFGSKWRPWDAAGTLDDGEARELTDLLERVGMAPHAGTGFGLRA